MKIQLDLTEILCDTTIRELLEVIRLKMENEEQGMYGRIEKELLELKTKLDVNPNEILTFAEEIRKYPERFEILMSGKWVTVRKDMGVSKYGRAEIINSVLNESNPSDIAYQVEFFNCGCTHKKIIRRKSNENNNRIIGIKFVGSRL